MPRCRNCEWKRRPVAAVVVRVVARVAPVALAVGVGLGAVHVFPQSEGVDRIVWWLAVVASATATLIGCQALFRRALTFSRLLDLEASFPASAPWRFRIALCAQLRRHRGATDPNGRA